MNKKKLTLLIVLSIITIMAVALVFAPIANSNATIETETEEVEEAPIQPSITKPELVIEEKELQVKGEAAPIEEPEPEPAPQPIIEEPITTDYSIPNVNTSFKSWMPYTAITNRASAAYKQQQYAYTDENGLRKIGDDYCVAMGTYYSSTIGERFKITMSTGATFTVIISDIKSNRHTDSTHRYTTRNGCMMEFLIDKSCLASCIRTSGNVGSLSLFSGQFAKVEKIS